MATSEYKYLNTLMYFYFPMPTIIISKGTHKLWKVFCAKKGTKINDTADIALQLAMKSNKIERKVK